MTKRSESPIQFTGDRYDALHPNNYNTTTEQHTEAALSWWWKMIRIWRGKEHVPTAVWERAGVDAVVRISQGKNQQKKDTQLFDDTDLTVEDRYPTSQVHLDGQRFYRSMINRLVRKNDLLALEHFYNEVLLNRGDLLPRVGSKEAVSHLKTLAEMHIQKLRNAQMGSEEEVFQEEPFYSRQERQSIIKDRKKRQLLYPFVEIIPNNRDILAVLNVTTEPIPPVIREIILTRRGEEIPLSELTTRLEQEQIEYFFRYFTNEKGLGKATAIDIAREYAQHLWFHKGSNTEYNNGLDMRLLHKINGKRTIVVHGYLDDPRNLELANIYPKRLTFQNQGDLQSASVRTYYKGIGAQEFADTRVGSVPLDRILIITSTDMYGKNPSTGFLYDTERHQQEAVFEVRKRIEVALSDFKKHGDVYSLVGPEDLNPIDTMHGNLALLTLEPNGFPTGEAGDDFEGNLYYPKCYLLLPLLQQVLSRYQIRLRSIASGTAHQYGAIDHNGVEVVVDPTLGQLVAGYDRIFIGTRTELERIIREAYSNNTLVNIDRLSDEDQGTLTQNPSVEEILFKFWRIGIWPAIG